jgi:drug/metabolite transporter (DMT)-like permease
LQQRSALLMLLAASIYAFTGVFSRAPLPFLPPVFLGALYFTLVGITAWLGLDPRGRVLRTLPWRIVWLWAAVVWMTLMIVTHFSRWSASRPPTCWRSSAPACCGASSSAHGGWANPICAETCWRVA